MLRAPIIAVLVAACQVPSLVPEPSTPPPWLADIESLRALARIALPAERPPGLETVTVSSAENDTPLVSFHSQGEPTVTLCSGPPGQCRKVVAAREELRVGATSGGPVVVLVEGAEGFGPDLTAEARAFWSEVELTTGQPAWMETR